MSIISLNLPRLERIMTGLATRFCARILALRVNLSNIVFRYSLDVGFINVFLSKLGKFYNGSLKLTLNRLTSMKKLLGEIDE